MENTTCSNNTGFYLVQKMKDFYEFLDLGENGEKKVMSQSQQKKAAGKPRTYLPKICYCCCVA